MNTTTAAEMVTAALHVVFSEHDVDQIAADHRVAVFRVVEGTIVRDLPSFGIKGTGEHVTFRVADIFEVLGDKITAHWEIADTGSLVHLAASQTH